MIQRKMGNKPPLKPAAQGWPAGLGWPEEAPRAQQSYTFRLQFAKLASELKARSQIAVGARYAQRQHLDGRKGRGECTRSASAFHPGGRDAKNRRARSFVAPRDRWLSK